MKTPVLFLIFNRPDLTVHSFNEIKKAKPEQLFIAADGPRKSKEGEALLCEKTRAIIKDITWPCEVKTLFRDENLGCKMALSSAITWFFENVEQGIIIEDDCIPNASFFIFCETMLARYKNDTRIGMVTGNNFVPNKTLEELDPPAETYYFQRQTYLWGWASWRRAWNTYDLEMKEWPRVKKERYLYSIFPKRAAASFESLFQMTYDGRATTWDPQWFLSSLLSGMLCIVPPRNLVSNIGILGEHSAKSGSLNNMPTHEISVMNLQNPFYIYPNVPMEKLSLAVANISTFSVRRTLVNTLELFRLNGIVRYLYRKYKFTF